MNSSLPYRKVAVFKGGISSEREVSLVSGESVANGLRSFGYAVEEVDVVDREPEIPFGCEAVFVALHGEYGEDGGVQSYLEGEGVPYTGSGPEASKRSFDKAVTKRLLSEHGLPTAEFEILEGMTDPPLPLPLVVKPTREGSSIGISRVFEKSQWEKALEDAFQYGREVLVERLIRGRECTVGIVGEETLPVVEIVPRDEYYSYEAKYGSAGTRYTVPAEIPASLADQCSDLALSLFRLLGCKGFGRVDFLVDADLNPYVLELNSIPGFTETSLLPKAARHAGIDFPQLCDRIVRLA